MDPQRAHDVIGINLPRALEHFRLLMEAGVKVIPRLPLIPGYSAGLDNLELLLEFLQPYPVEEIHLLPFHQYGEAKYDLIGMDYLLQGIPGMPHAAMKRHVLRCKEAGYRVTVGG